MPFFVAMIRRLPASICARPRRASSVSRVAQPAPQAGHLAPINYLVERLLVGSADTACQSDAGVSRHGLRLAGPPWLNTALAASTPFAIPNGVGARLSIFRQWALVNGGSSTFSPGVPGWAGRFLPSHIPQQSSSERRMSLSISLTINGVQRTVELEDPGHSSGSTARTPGPHWHQGLRSGPVRCVPSCSMSTGQFLHGARS
jgi:hypothetical protein